MLELAKKIDLFKRHHRVCTVQNLYDSKRYLSRHGEILRLFTGSQLKLAFQTYPKQRMPVIEEGKALELGIIGD